MLRNENRVEIDRSPEDVFAFVADLCNEPRYVPNVLETEKISDGPCGVGSKYREVTRVMFGRKAVATYEITQYDPPQTFAFRGTSGRSKFRGRWAIEATEDGTLAKFTAEAKLAWPMKYMERVIRGSVAETFAAMGRNLKRVMQAPAAGEDGAAKVADAGVSATTTASSSGAASAAGKRRAASRSSAAQPASSGTGRAEGARTSSAPGARTSPARSRTPSPATGQRANKPAAKRASRSSKTSPTKNQTAGGASGDDTGGGPGDSAGDASDAPTG